MTKSCSICSQSREIQDKILEAHQTGLSYKKIEEQIKNNHQIKVSYSAIQRHLNKCIIPPEQDKKERSLTFQEKRENPQPEGAEIHNALCHILLEGVEMFSQRMNETLDKTTDYGTHLETYRCLDLLIKMLTNLYPNIHNKKGEKTVSAELYQLFVQQASEAQQETYNILNGLCDLIDDIKNSLDDTQISDLERKTLEEKLVKVIKLLDYSKMFVPRVKSFKEENRNLLKRIEDIEHNQTEGDQHHVSQP